MSHPDPDSEKSSLPKGLQVETLASGYDPEKGDTQQAVALPPEVGGRDGPEPTRFGDWEKSGRCIDF